MGLTLNPLSPSLFRLWSCQIGNEAWRDERERERLRERLGEKKRERLGQKERGRLGEKERILETQEVLSPSLTREKVTPTLSSLK